MSFTQKVLFPLTDHIDTSVIEHKNVFEGEGDRITLKAWGDDFDDSSLDTDNFGTSVNSDGVITETTSLSIDSPDSIDDAAILYYKTVLNPRATKNWGLSYKFKCQDLASGTFLFLELWQGAGTPVVTDSTTWASGRIALIAQGSTGQIRFLYLNTSSTAIYWNGTIWTTTPSDAYSGSLGTDYVAKLRNDGTKLYFELWNSGESSLLASAETPWSDVKAESGNLYSLAGEPYTNTYYGEMILSNFTHTNRYATSSPSPAAEWVVLPIGSVIDVSTAKYWRYKDDVLIESLIDADVQTKKASNGGVLGSAETLSAFRAGSNITITDATNSFQVVGVYASDGTYESKSSAWMECNVIFPDGAAGGGLGVINRGLINV